MGKHVSRIMSRVIPAVFCLLALFSCEDLAELLDGDGDDEVSIPQDVLDLAEGVFSLVGMVFESDYDDPTDDPSYPVGVSVAWITEPTELRMTLSGFEPDDWAGVVADGSIVLTQTSSSPITITIEGSLALTGHSRTSVAMAGTATWPTGGDLSEDEPESITGTFEVDGTAYDLAAITSALSDEGDDSGDTTATLTPLPEIFRTCNGDFAQLFDDQVWRTGPAEADAHWSTYSYMTFAISGDGAQHTLYLAGTESGAGHINWYTDGATQKLDFLDADGGILYSFTVLAHTKNHLHLLSDWGTETREWIFAAGTDNLTGMVVDSSNPVMEPPYYYEKPLEGAVVQIGTLDDSGTQPVFTPIGGLETVTDARGYFELGDLSAAGSGELAMRVTKTGYTDNVDPVEGTVTSSSTIFKYVSLAPSS